MAQPQASPLTWSKLINGIGSAFIAFMTITILGIFAAGYLDWMVGTLLTVVLVLGGALLAWGLYTFFERL